MIFDKSYLESQYKMAYADYVLAHNEDERWSALKRMAKQERVILEDGHGEDWLLSMKKRVIGVLCDTSPNNNQG